MKYPIKNVFIIGGTGFLGYHSALEFLKKGIAVSSASVPDVELGDWFPREINIVSENLDIFEVSEEKIAEALTGHEAMVYGVGPDDRVVPPAPSYDFFHDRLVVQCSKAVRAARRAGVRRVVIMNSYFAFFDRRPPYDGLLSRSHPYIRARVEQAQACIDLGEKGVMDVMILELPYIFGCMPGRIPLWKEVFLDRFDKMAAVFFPGGGTVMIHVRGVGEAVVAASVNGEHGCRYPIGVHNMKYKEMIRIMYESIGRKKKVITVPAWIAYLGGLALQLSYKRRGREGGLHFARLMTQIQSRDLFYDPGLVARVKKELDYAGLGYSRDRDIVEAIRATALACYPENG